MNTEASSLSKIVLICANSSWYLWKFRISISVALRANGYTVVLCSPDGAESRHIEAMGFRHIPCGLGNGFNVGKDFFFLAKLLIIITRLKPSVVASYTPKVNIYSGLVCRLLKIPRIHNISGLGTAYISGSWLGSLAEIMYRHALAGAPKVFFQNPDDHELFLLSNTVEKYQAEVIPGSGVDTSFFAPDAVHVRRDSLNFKFLFCGRLILQKGLVEYVHASNILRELGYEFESGVIGGEGLSNPSRIELSQIRKWIQDRSIVYYGYQEDVRWHMLRSDCIVLPSYREGLPRVLLEAASLGKPIVATDVPGCRAVVDNGVTGFLCRPKDIDDLATNMRRMLDLPQKTREKMGDLAREKVERCFKEDFVISRYLSVINKLTSGSTI